MITSPKATAVAGLSIPPRHEARVRPGDMKCATLSADPPTPEREKVRASKPRAAHVASNHSRPAARTGAIDERSV